MAIATDASSLTSSGGYANSLTISHTVAGSDRLLLVGVHCRTATADVTGVTYNGTAMTLLGTNENSGVVGVQWYSLVAPAAGTHDVVVSLGGYKLFAVAVYSLTGVDQTTPVEASDFSTTNLDGYGASLSWSITTLTAGARIVTIAATKDDAAGFVAGSGATVLQSADDPGGSLGGTALQILDVPTAGSTAYSLSWTTSTNWRGGTLVLKPSAGAAPDDPETADISSDVVVQAHADARAFASLYALPSIGLPNFIAVSETPRAVGETGQAHTDAALQAFALPWHPAYDALEFSLNEDAASTVYTLTADVGSFAATGVDASLLYNRVLTADVGAFALTGVAAGTLYNRLLTADTVAYSLTGIDAALFKGRTLTADVGAFALTGNAAGLLRAAVLTADVGAFTLTGVAANLVKPGSYALTADTGSFALTGVAANLLKASRLTADVGAYALAGIAAGGGKAYALTGAAGAFVVTGYAANLGKVYTLSAGTGAYQVTGFDANLLAPTWTDAPPPAGVWSPTTDASGVWTPTSDAAGSWS